MANGDWVAREFVNDFEVAGSIKIARSPDGDRAVSVTNVETNHAVSQNGASVKSEPYLMMVELTYSGSTLDVGDSVVELEDPIQKAMEVDGIVVVLLEYTDLSPENENRNVLGFDVQGDRLWRIEPAPGSEERDNQYTGMGIRGGRLVAHTWRGMSVTVDLDTGAWEKYGLTK